jgi:3'(2'), 5'-bisphosphate nucleotidase
MNSIVISNLESGLKNIGDQIKLWREDEKYRSILEPKAFKTQADINANVLIKTLLEELDPGCVVISEEDGAFKNKRPEKYWLVDPIDGTASWFDGFDGFVTQLAYIKNDIPLYGAVYAPCLKKLWTALKGNGAYLNGERLDELKYIDRLNLIDNYPEPQRVAKTIFESMPVTSYIECGSIGLKACLVADGTADLFVKDVVIRDWDIAPAEVILLEVNAIIKDFNSKNIEYKVKFEKNNGLIVARDDILFEATLNTINNKGKKV